MSPPSSPCKDMAQRLVLSRSALSMALRFWILGVFGVSEPGSVGVGGAWKTRNIGQVWFSSGHGASKVSLKSPCQEAI